MSSLGFSRKDNNNNKSHRMFREDKCLLLPLTEPKDQEDGFTNPALPRAGQHGSTSLH